MLSLLSPCVKEDVFTLCMYISISYSQPGHLTRSVSESNGGRGRDFHYTGDSEHRNFKKHSVIWMCKLFFATLKKSHLTIETI